MRVIAGEFRSRRLRSLAGAGTRPTPDRLRETLFNILSPRIAGAIFLDAYAGTGAVGIEALSRGARRAIFLEKSRGAVDIIRHNLDALGVARNAAVIPGPVLRALRNHAADIVFLDPPYDQEREYAAAMQTLGESETALVVAQHSRFHPLAADYGRLHRVRQLRQGDNMLSFYEGSPASDDDGIP
jgi:16S rRNA (guanine(966)-N(2))-methyltransferase RsmD